MSSNRLARLDGVIGQAIRRGEAPGAVILVARRGTVVVRKAYGRRAVKPGSEPMTIDTVFDLASMTKVMAGGPGIMLLVERGQLRLTDTLARYVPEFASYGKEGITLRQMLTHYSGLRPDLDMSPAWKGYDTAIKMACAEHPAARPGTRFIYSDINFFMLGDLVRRTSGKPLDKFVAENIYRPLNMRHTTFKPPAAWLPKIAPTALRNGKIIRGVVHDPTSYRMGGVAGHAGLFSTADDTAIYAQMLLNGGVYDGVRVFSPTTVLAMTTRQSPAGASEIRGYGWDINSRFSTNRGDLLPRGSYGHTGYTGTSIWIDPTSDLFVILMTSRLHPGGKGNVVRLRSKVANVVAGAILELGRMPTHAEGETPSEAATAASYQELDSTHRQPPLQLGIDVLESDHFRALLGKRIGLITNHTGLDRKGRSTIDLLFKAKGIQLVSLFSPEHGIRGTLDSQVSSSVDEATGLPIHSLYGNTRRPSEDMLKGLDVLIFDIQDIGCRFYTYITTLAYAMEEAAKRGIRFVVLDRPNPINGKTVEGPLLDKDKLSFVGYFPMPIRHGMTVGELAKLFNEENRIGAELQVIPLRGWNRRDLYDRTELLWVNPSPNMRSLTEAILYPGIGALETTNLSVGRGTDTPFEVVGAPWIEATRLARRLNKRRIRGVRFIPIRFRPDASVYAGQACQGVNLVLTDREAFHPVLCGLEIASTLWRLYPDKFQLDKMIRLIGNQKTLDRLRAGEDPRDIAASWKDDLTKFRRLRSKYLLY